MWGPNEHVQCDTSISNIAGELQPETIMSRSEWFNPLNPEKMAARLQMTIFNAGFNGMFCVLINISVNNFAWGPDDIKPTLAQVPSRAWRMSPGNLDEDPLWNHQAYTD